MEYRKQAHTVYYTQYHIVISTKYRRKVLKGGIGEYLKKKVLQVSTFHPEIEIIEVNTDVDHVHLLVSIPPKFSVSRVVNMIKANTGPSMRRRFPFLDKVYWGNRMSVVVQKTVSDLGPQWSAAEYFNRVGKSREIAR